MLMVVFGAGASFDSAPSFPDNSPSPLSELSGGRIATSRPPLADQLFDERPQFAEILHQFPACHGVVSRLRKRIGDKSVEQVLETLQAEADDYYEQGHCQLAAIRYYLQTMIADCEARWEEVHKGVTNYHTLLDHIHRRIEQLRRVCLVTFNYDRLLEAAMTTVGIHIQSMSDYVDSPEYKVIKLHGSVNWGRNIATSPMRELHQLRAEQIPAEVILRAPALLKGKFVTNDFVIAKAYPNGKVKDTAIFPAIAIPLEKKHDFECPENHISALYQCIQQTKKLLVIGWSATDEPFLDFLKDQLPRNISAMIIAGNGTEADSIADRFQTKGIRGPFQRGDLGFTTSLESGEVERFLKS